MKSIIIGMIFIGLSVVTASIYAGWFGPSNYNDCVIDKMKGQDRYLLGHVEKACWQDFPNHKRTIQVPCPNKSIDCDHLRGASAMELGTCMMTELSIRKECYEDMDYSQWKAYGSRK